MIGCIKAEFYFHDQEDVRPVSLYLTLNDLLQH